MEDRPVTQKELDALEDYLGKVWKTLGIDIAFSNHFVDRINHARNGKQITIKELGELYVKQFKQHGPDIKKTGKPEGEIEAILTKLSSNLNIPFVLRYNRRTKYLDLVGITVMRKAGFKSNKPQEKQYTVENKLGIQGMFFDTAAKTDLIKSVQSVMQESAARHARENYILSEVFGSSDVRQLTMEEKDIFDAIMENVTTDMDEEDLHELSKKTLGSYIKKASGHAGRLERSGAQADALAVSSDNRDDKNALYKRADSRYGKAEKRYAGISKATDRLTKEEVVDEDEVNELSKKTLGSYVKKAALDGAGKAHKAATSSALGNMKDSNKNFSKAMDRMRGVSKAADKLAKEEVDLDEDEVNELSKKTLGSYVNKAAAQAVHSQTQKSSLGQSMGNTNSASKKALLKTYYDIHSKNVGKRIGGIKQATDRLTKEEVVDEEEVNELSKNTLANYVRKATFSKNRGEMKMMNARSAEQFADGAKEHDKRSAGLSRVKKEDLDEDEVNELSKKTLGSYIKKASTDKSQAAYDMGKDKPGSHIGKYVKRDNGISKATDRLTKEDLDESKEAMAKAKENYDMHHKALGDHIASLQKLHKSLGKVKSPHWGHVGTISDVNSKIKNVLDDHGE